MNIPEIRRNIEREKRILEEIRILKSSIQSLDKEESSFYNQTINSLINQLKMLNSAILPLLGGISVVKPLIKKPTLIKEKRKLSPKIFPKKNIRSLLEKRLQFKPLEEKKKPALPKQLEKKISKVELKDKMQSLEKKISSLESKVEKKQDSTISRVGSVTEKMSALPKIQIVELPKNTQRINKNLKVKYVSKVTKEPVMVTISAKDKEAFAKELKLSEYNLSKLQKVKKKKIKKKPFFTRRYAKFSNKFFSSTSIKFAPQFKDLKQDLKLSNAKVLLQSYLSMALMTTAILSVGVLLLFIVLVLINPALLLKNWYWIFLPIASFLGFYFYPSMQKGSMEKEMMSELPFATIYMSAIAGSNVEPIRIFRIISESKEYTSFGAEIKKIISQVELYGYDLVTALKNVAKSTMNNKFAELLEGMATNVLSGGSLKNYLDKKAENFLMDYKLERQKYSGVAGTFMDIYISVLITAPLILMMVFVVISLTGMASSISSTFIFVLTIGGVVLANIIFLVVLHLNQPAV